MSSTSPSRAPKTDDDDAAAPMQTIIEGSCHMSCAADKANDVFYNPVQVQNRDLSVLMLALYGERRQKLQYEQCMAWEEKQRQRRAEAQEEAAQTSTVTTAATTAEPVTTTNAPPPPPPLSPPPSVTTESVERGVSLGSSLRLALSRNAGAAAAPKTVLTTAERMKLRRAVEMEPTDAPNTTTTTEPPTHLDARPSDDHAPTPTDAPENNTPAADASEPKQPAADDRDFRPTEIPKVQLHVLDALAASGLRSMRYWKECPQYISHITINDMEPAATERARDALARNDLSDVVLTSDWNQGRPPGIRVTTQDATQLLYLSRQKHKKRPNVLALPEPLTPEEASALQWDVIDLDPYGTAAPFLDAAIQAIAHGGMLNITCTDMRVMSGAAQPELCFNRYGSFPMRKAGYWNEMALRMLLYAIAMTAAKYGRTIKPILSVGMDFYIRIFVEVYDNKKECHDVCLKVGYVYQSTQCPTFYTAPLAEMGGENNNVHQPSRLRHSVCQETGGALKIGGPIWLGPLHDQTVLKAALDRLGENRGRRRPTSLEPNMQFLATRARLLGLLTACQQEVPDAPLYYVYPELSKSLHSHPMPLHSIMSAIANAGYQVSGYHKEPMAIKTNAPPSVVWDVMRASVLHRPLEKPSIPGSVAEKILSVPPSFEVSFNQSKGVRDKRLQNQTVARFPMNPEPNWGPKAMATGGKKRKNVSTDEDLQE
jgi:tRNA (guanine26-N2/guanine27-N2)-dimethyltransferase